MAGKEGQQTANHGRGLKVDQLFGYHREFIDVRRKNTLRREARFFKNIFGGYSETPNSTK